MSTDVELRRFNTSACLNTLPIGTILDTGKAYRFKNVALTAVSVFKARCAWSKDLVIQGGSLFRLSARENRASANTIKAKSRLDRITRPTH